MGFLGSTAGAIWHLYRAESKPWKDSGTVVSKSMKSSSWNLRLSSPWGVEGPSPRVPLEAMLEGHTMRIFLRQCSGIQNRAGAVRGPVPAGVPVLGLLVQAWCPAAAPSGRQGQGAAPCGRQPNPEEGATPEDRCPTRKGPCGPCCAS